LTDLLIRNARLRGREQPVDIAIAQGRITAVDPDLPASAAQTIDAAGDLVVPGFVNLHLHADKALLGEVMRPNVSGTLPEAIEITNDFKRKYDPAEVAQRASRVIETGVKNGTTFFRLFADVGTIGGVRAAQGLLLAREKYKGYCDIQVVAFPQEGIVRDPGAAELLAEALKEGCDVVGGLPWYEYTDEEARAHIDICFDLAKRHELGDGDGVGGGQGKVLQVRVLDHDVVVLRDLVALLHLLERHLVVAGVTPEAVAQRGLVPVAELAHGHRAGVARRVEPDRQAHQSEDDDSLP